MSVDLTADLYQKLGGARRGRRIIALILFLATVILFRHLALMLVTAVVFSRALLFLGGYVSRVTGWSERRGVLVIIGSGLVILGLAAWLGVHLSSKWLHSLRALYEGKSLTQIVIEMQEDIMARLPSWLPLDGLKEKAPELVTPMVEYLRATGRVLLHALIGVILSILYALDREPVDSLIREPADDSVVGGLRRYFGFLAEAIVITISLQVLVALVNTALTLPVLVALRLPHLAAFCALIFFSSLVPVVGNLVSGAVLILASFAYRGIIAVILFLVTTFLLHKIEAYYLNPRLAARHVNLPALVLVVSLILHEHAFGLVGLFLSFPVLYVGLNIAQDLRNGNGAPVVAEVP
jgi:predicted PurR-regulated permease PerM